MKDWQDRERVKIGQLAAIVEGRGSQIILLHGVGLRAEAWQPQISSLSKKYSVLAVDMPGHGKSTAITAKTLNEYAACYEELMRTPSIIVGHSMGSMIALELAARHPEAVKGVVALNAIHRRSQAAKDAVVTRAAELDGKSVSDPSGALDRWFGARSSPERMACARWLTQVNPAGYKTAYTVFASSDGPSDAQLKGLTCPALFMTGGLEPNSTPEMSEAMANLTPKGSVHTIKDAAHMMPMTHSDKVTAQLEGFAESSFAKE